MPVGVLRSLRLSMQCGDRGLKSVGSARPASQRSFGQLQTLRNLVAMPQIAILLFQQNDLSRSRARVPPRVMQKHQGKQSFGLSRFWHEYVEQSPQANRLAAQFAPNEYVARGRVVPLVKDEVHDEQNRIQPLGQLVICRDF